MERLTRDHAASPAIKEVLPGLQYAVYMLGSDLLVPLFEKIRQVNPDPDVKAGATFNLAFALWNSGPGVLGATADLDKQAAAKKRAGELFRAIAKDYPDADVAEEAAGYIYELDHLQIGMKAPEIVGLDASGKEIKLSQFKGRVVVLDFWGFW